MGFCSFDDMVPDLSRKGDQDLQRETGASEASGSSTKVSYSEMPL